MNATIKEELGARMTKAREEFGKVSKKIERLLEYYDRQSLSCVVNKTVALIAEGIYWDEPVQAAGFEWYCDGTTKPTALGYGYESIRAPVLANFTTGKSSRARDDFNGNATFGTQLFSDSGQFDVAAACFPLYEYLDVENSRDDDVDRLINLFTARLLYAMHLAMSVIASAEEFKALPTKSPFFFFANNHDWSPVLVYALVDSGASAEDFGESDEMRVPSLQKFIDGLEKKKVKKLLKEDYLLSIRNGPVELLEKALLDLPFLRSAGHSLKLSGTDLTNFLAQRISSDDVYPELSFDALLNFFEATAKLRQPDIDYAITYLFLRSPGRATEYISELMSRDESMNEEVLRSIKNLLRWISETNVETRWDNPLWALQKSKGAVNAMKSMLASRSD